VARGRERGPEGITTIRVPLTCPTRLMSPVISRHSTETGVHAPTEIQRRRVRGAWREGEAERDVLTSPPCPRSYIMCVHVHLQKAPPEGLAAARLYVCAAVCTCGELISVCAPFSVRELCVLYARVLRCGDPLLASSALACSLSYVRDFSLSKFIFRCSAPSYNELNFKE
jgi:hypothetical protein